MAILQVWSSQVWRHQIWRSKIVVAHLVGAIFVILVIVGVRLEANEQARKAELSGQNIALPAAPPPSPKSPAKSDKPKPPAPAAKPPQITSPSTVLGLASWKLTLPVNTSRPGAPDEIKQPELSTFTQAPYFFLNSAKNGVVFRAHVNGDTTGGSDYPRSELREMANGGRDSASWSNSIGTHTMIIRQAITHLPPAKPEVVAGQIHDASDDVIMVRLEGKRLFVEGDGEEIGLLNSNYSLGTIFTVKIVAAEERIKVYYNGALKVTYRKSGSGYYFKAGCYTQSNTSKGDKPGAYGEVVIYGLSVSHSY